MARNLPFPSEISIWPDCRIRDSRALRIDKKLKLKIAHGFEVVVIGT
jgi:hypothetical protein